MLWLIGEKKEEFSALSNELISEGFTCLFFKRISESLNFLNKETPEAIIINANHNEISCFEFCHRIKSSSHLKKIKLIILSSNNSEVMEEAVFDAGADEFVVMPIRPKALVKRISTRLNLFVTPFSILHKNNGKTSLQIDKESFSVYLYQMLVPLSRKEFELLHLIAGQPGKAFKREEIFIKVWKRNYISKERTIDVHILRLRKKLGEEFILTQKGVGYRFIA